MPIVTDALFNYWHSRDGVKTGGNLHNIAPGGSAKNLAIIGGGQIADQSIRLDAIDDYMTTPFSGAPYSSYGQPFTLQFVLTPRSTGMNDYEIMDCGIFAMRSGNGIYFEYTHSTSPATTGVHTGVSQFGTAAPMMLTFAYNGGTILRFYVNGSLIASQNLRTTTCLAAGGYDVFSLFRGLYSNKAAADIWAVRVYTKELSAAEVTQNWGEGTNIGLTAPVVPMVKIAEFRTAGQNIPIYSITNHPNQPLRVQTANGRGFIPLVPINDPDASKIRMQTPAGIRAWRK